MLYACIVYSNDYEECCSYGFVNYHEIKELKKDAIMLNKQGYKVSVEVYDKDILVYSMELNHI